MTGKTHELMKEIRNIEINFIIFKYFEVDENANIEASSTEAQCF